MSIQTLIGVILVLIIIQSGLRMYHRWQKRKGRKRFNISDRRKEQTLQHLVDEED